MEVTVLDSLGAVPEADWRHLAAGRPLFQQLAWYRSAPAPGRLRLLAAYRDGRPVALLPIYLVEAAGHYYHSPRELLCGVHERQLLAATGHPLAPLSRAAEAEWFPAAVSMSPYGYRGGWIAATDDAAVAAAVAAAADDLCRREGVRLALGYGLMQEHDRCLIDALAARGARTLVIGAHCGLKIGWQSLEDYFRALGPRGRRLRSKHRQALASREVRWRRWTRCGDGFDRALRSQAIALFSATARAHDHPDPPVALYQALLAAWPGRRHLLAGQRADGSLRSALLVLEQGTTWYPKLFGTSVPGDYFFLTYSWLIELAISRGVTRIEYGGGSHRAKLLRGARLRWLLAMLQVYDRRLADLLADLVPPYEAAKLDFFGELARRYQSDRRAPRPPTYLDRPVTQT